MGNGIEYTMRPAMLDRRMASSKQGKYAGSGNPYSIQSSTATKAGRWASRQADKDETYGINLDAN